MTAALEDRVTALEASNAELRAILERAVPASRVAREERERAARKARFAAVKSLSDWTELSREDRAAYSAPQEHLVAMVKAGTEDQREAFLASRSFAQRAGLHFALCQAPALLRVSTEKHTFQMPAIAISDEQAEACRTAGLHVDEDGDHRTSLRGLWLGERESLVFDERAWRCRVLCDERLRLPISDGRLRVTRVDETEARALKLREFMDRWNDISDATTTGARIDGPQLPSIAL